jgi:two-component system, sensor histidine kinase and response regulator
MNAQTEVADILVVDDTSANLRLLAQLLTEHGYKVRAVLSGERALIAAQSAVPDLILLDVRMPGLDGYETCRRLKSDERTRETPVLFISALYDVEDKLTAFASGGVDYITKPFQPQEVLVRVETQLSLRRLQRELKRANAELAVQVGQLQEHVEELDAFAHTVAHDLNNPLLQITGYAETLLEFYHEIPTDEVLRALGGIVRGGHKLGNIIEELLLLAGVRKTEVELEPLDMRAIVTEALERLADMFQQHGARVVVPGDWSTEFGHAPWIEQVWINYLSNGCKYGGQPAVLILGSDVLPNGEVRFWVQDNGRGLTPAEQARLFVPFTRLEQVRAKGYGLGLSVARRIVEKLGGQVGVESTGVPGQGSKFYFTLPEHHAA